MLHLFIVFLVHMITMRRTPLTLKIICNLWNLVTSSLDRNPINLRCACGTCAETVKKTRSTARENRHVGTWTRYVLVVFY